MAGSVSAAVVPVKLPLDSVSKPFLPSPFTAVAVTVPEKSLPGPKDRLTGAEGSVTARGSTIIRNAAIEPEVVELILFLQKLGAIITLDVDRTIRIQGTRSFHDVEHTVIPDRIEAASWGMAAISSRGRVFGSRIGAGPIHSCNFSSTSDEHDHHQGRHHDLL